MKGVSFFISLVIFALFFPVFPSRSAESLDKRLEDTFFSVTKYNSGEEKMKNLEVEDMDRNQAFLTEDKERISIINYWAPWCTACISELPTLKIFQEKHPDILVVYVADDKSVFPVVQEMADRTALPKEHSYFDARSYVRKWQKVSVYPTTLVVASTGDVLYRIEGDTDWSKPLMSEFVESLKKQGK